MVRKWGLTKPKIISCAPSDKATISLNNVRHKVGSFYLYGAGVNYDSTTIKAIGLIFNYSWSALKVGQACCLSYCFVHTVYL
jgi:hypothetical protein